MSRGLLFPDMMYIRFTSQFWSDFDSQRIQATPLS